MAENARSILEYLSGLAFEYLVGGNMNGIIYGIGLPKNT